MTTRILDINKVKQLLDNEDIYEDDDGNKLQTIYLGSILNLTPSGKMYMPFACSNLNPCTKCNGEGVIRNKHGKRKKYENTRKKRTQFSFSSLKNNRYDYHRSLDCRNYHYDDVPI